MSYLRFFYIYAKMLIFGLIYVSLFSILVCRNFVNEAEKPINFECRKGNTFTTNSEFLRLTYRSFFGSNRSPRRGNLVHLCFSNNEFCQHSKGSRQVRWTQDEELSSKAQELKRELKREHLREQAFRSYSLEEEEEEPCPVGASLLYKLLLPWP